MQLGTVGSDIFVSPTMLLYGRHGFGDDVAIAGGGVGDGICGVVGGGVGVVIL